MICMHLYLTWNIGPPFLLNLLIAWLVRSCYLIWVIFVVWISSALELAHIRLFPDLFAQLSLCGAHRDPHACWTRQIIWEDHSLPLVSLLETFGVTCWKNQAVFCKPRCPLVWLKEITISFSRIFFLLNTIFSPCTGHCPKCALPASLDK